MKKTYIPSVVFQPNAQQSVQQGIDLIADVVGPTLGPLPRLVGVEPIGPGDKRPELLDNGALIARRILALPNRDQDMGAMFMRHVLWRQHERVGDGTATTAVLFHSIFTQALKYIAGGGNATRLRRPLEDGLRVILDELTSRAIPLDGQQRVAQIAESIGHDPALAQMLGEVFDIVSEHGEIELRSGHTHELRRDYVTGTFYKGKLVAEWMMTDPGRSRADLEDAAIVTTDLRIEDPAELIPLARLVSEAGIRSLMLVTRDISASAIGVLSAAGRAARPCKIIAVRAPDNTIEPAPMLDDLAMLTGARLFLSVAGDSLRTVKLADLGGARRAWADQEFYGIVGGKGAPRQVRAYVARLRAALGNVEDQDARKQIRQRVARLLGATAVLWIGGLSDSDISARKEVAERTCEAVRTTIGQGFVPGGGVALLACRPALRRLAEQTDDPDARVTYRILMRALEEPIRTIIQNAGYESEPWLDRIERAGAGYGLDVRSGEIVDMAAAGIIDSAGVLLAAVREAVSSAGLALTVDVLIHKKRPKTSFTP